MTIAISKRLARQQGRAKADFVEDDDDDGEQYEIADDKAAAHTGRTAANSGVTIDVVKQLSTNSLEIFQQVSYRWHQFLGLVDVSSQVSGQKRKSEADVQDVKGSKRLKSIALGEATRD